MSLREDVRSVIKELSQKKKSRSRRKRVTGFGRIPAGRGRGARMKKSKLKNVFTNQKPVDLSEILS